jgi:hypothetical protein
MAPSNIIIPLGFRKAGLEKIAARLLAALSAVLFLSIPVRMEASVIANGQILPIGEQYYWAFTNVATVTQLTANVWTNGVIPSTTRLGTIGFGPGYNNNFWVIPANNITFKSPISCNGQTFMTNNSIIAFSNVVEYAVLTTPISGYPDVATISGYFYIDGDIVGTQGGTYDLVSLGTTQTNGAN